MSTVPDAWLTAEPGFATPTELRRAYVTHLTNRAHRSTEWLPSAPD